MSIADALIAAAEVANRQGCRPHVYLMNEHDYNDVMGSVDYDDVRRILEKRGRDYHERTTLVSQLAMARRLSGRRNERFRAKEWLVK